MIPIRISIFSPTANPAMSKATARQTKTWQMGFVIKCLPSVFYFPNPSHNFREFDCILFTICWLVFCLKVTIKMSFFFPSQDKWSCQKCDNLNRAFHRFCDFCWTLRPDWLPEKDAGTLFTKAQCTNPAANCLPAETVLIAMPSQNETREFLPDSAADVLTSLQTLGGVDFLSVDVQTSSQDSGFLSEGLDMHDSQHDDENDLSARSSNSAATTTIQAGTSNIDRLGSGDDVARDALPATIGGNDGVANVLNGAGLCIVCLSRPKDASMVHGSTGHQACCYTCAKRLRRRGKPCPVCRRPIQKVIKNYIVWRCWRSSICSRFCFHHCN